MYKRFLLGISCLFVLTISSVSIYNSVLTPSKNGQVKGIFEDLDKKSFSSLSSLEAKNLIEQKKLDKSFEILDVRNSQERNLGFIKNSINLDFYNSNFEQNLDNLDKNKSYLVYCKTGFRSKKTTNLMKEKGFSQVYNLNGGILAWEYQGFEISKLN